MIAVAYTITTIDLQVILPTHSNYQLHLTTSNMADELKKGDEVSWNWGSGQPCEPDREPSVERDGLGLIG